MTGADPVPRLRRWALVAVLSVSALLLLLVVALAYLSSSSFNEYLRGRFVASLQQATGGDVQVGSFRWRLSRLDVEVRDISVHRPQVYGRAANIHVERLRAELKFSSLLRGSLSLARLRIDRPYFELVTNPSGGQETSVSAAPAGGSSIQELFSVTADRLEVTRGELRFHDRRIPLDFTADDVAASAALHSGPQHYEGHLHAGKVDTVFEHWRPIASIATVEFALFSDHIDFKAVQLSGKSRLLSQGRITDFNNPRAEFQYQATLDIAQARAITRTSSAVSGVLIADGHGTYDRSAYGTSGKLQLRQFAYKGPELRVRNVEVKSGYDVANDLLTLSRLSATALGGAVSGEVRLTNWNSLGPDAPRDRPQRGIARLRLDSLSLRQLAQAVSTRRVPADSLQLAGLASGRVDANWTGAPQLATAQLGLTINPVRSPHPGELAVGGRLRGTYRGRPGVLQIDDLQLATAASHFAAHGVLGSSNSNLKLTAASSNLEEFQPLLQRLQFAHQLPVRVHGVATFEGTASGRLFDPLLAGNVQVTNFDTLLGMSSVAHPARELHWDFLSTGLQLSSHQVEASNGMLRRGGAQMRFSFTAGLDHSRFTDSSPLTAAADVSAASLDDVQALAGTAYPIRGTVDFSFRAHGTRLDPGGEGRVEITHARIYGESFERASSSIAFNRHEAQFNDVLLLHRQATISGSAAYNLNTTAFRFNFRSTDLDLARVQRIQSSRLAVAGTMNFRVEGSGTRDAPSINGKLVLRDLILNGEREGQFTADLATRGEDLTLTGRSVFEHANLALDGSIRMRSDFLSDLTLRFSRLDIDPLLHAYLRGRITGHSSTEGTVHVTGPLLHPRQLNGTVDLEQFAADIENAKIQNDGPIRASIRDRLLSIQSFRLVGDGTDISASGTAQLADPWHLDLRADGRVNLRVLETVNPDYLSYGLVTVAMRVGGTLFSPDFEGELQIAHGGLSYIDLPSGLSEINGVMTFDRDRLSVQSLNAKTGGGTLTLGGYITYGRKVNFDLTARGKDVRLRYPPGISSTANLDVRLLGSLTSSVLSGDILITRFAFNPDFDLAVYMARAKQAAPLTPPNSPLNNLKIDVHVTSTPELQVQTTSAKLSGDIDLRVRGTGTHPAVLGRVNITQGQVSFNGTKYELERGDISFSNPVTIEPIFDLEATARVRDYDITLGFHGPVDKLSTTYSSDPPLPTADIIALLAVGRTREESAMLQSQNTENFAQSTSNAILGEALNQTVSNRLEKLFGVSRIKIDPEAGGAENNTAGTRVTVEQQVSNNLTLTYITNVSQAQQQIIQAEYYVTKNLSIIAVRDQNGVLGFDVRLRRRKK